MRGVLYLLVCLVGGGLVGLGAAQIAPRDCVRQTQIPKLVTIGEGREAWPVEFENCGTTDWQGYKLRSYGPMSSSVVPTSMPVPTTRRGEKAQVNVPFSRDAPKGRYLIEILLLNREDQVVGMVAKFDVNVTMPLKI